MQVLEVFLLNTFLWNNENHDLYEVKNRKGNFNSLISISWTIWMNILIVARVDSVAWEMLSSGPVLLLSRSGRTSCLHVRYTPQSRTSWRPWERKWLTRWTGSSIEAHQCFSAGHKMQGRICPVKAMERATFCIFLSAVLLPGNTWQCIYQVKKRFQGLLWDLSGNLEITSKPLGT